MCSIRSFRELDAGEVSLGVQDSFIGAAFILEDTYHSLSGGHSVPAQVRTTPPARPASDLRLPARQHWLQYESTPLHAEALDSQIPYLHHLRTTGLRNPYCLLHRSYSRGCV
jgi:hypothetical protein